MGRPRKQTVDYFPHFVNTDSRTKFILEQNWGNDGYAFWFKLLELLGRSEGHYYDFSMTSSKMYIAAMMKMEENTVIEILNVLADNGNIDKELWEERNIIWCQSLVDNLQDVYAKRTVSAPLKPFTEIPQTPKPEKPTTEPTKDKPAAPERRKRGRPRKQEAPKVAYTQLVRMTEDEYGKLVERFGEEKAKRAIEILSNYKGASGRTYKSDYCAILNWVMSRVEDEISRQARERTPNARERTPNARNRALNYKQQHYTGEQLKEMGVDFGDDVYEADDSGEAAWDE